MADTKTSDESAGSTIVGTEVHRAVQSGVNVKFTYNQVRTFVIGAGSASVASGKTITVSNTLTLAGTDSTVMTFPSTSATIARTDAANTFTGDQTLTSASLIFSGNISAAAWTTNGARIKGASVSLTDTSSSGTVAAAYTNFSAGCTILASSPTTYTNYFGSYFTDPVASTNVTMTNKWALGADSLRVGTSNALTISSVGQVTALNGIVLAGGMTVTGGAAVNCNNNASQFIIGDSRMSRAGAQNWQLGSVASATPLPYTFTVGEFSRSGTDSNVGGANGTFQSGTGTGTGTASSLIFQTPILVASGTGAQTQTTRMTLGLSAVFGAAAIATNATDGFIYIATCAGTPTGTPTTQTGRVALVYDTTNHQFWIYDGAWLQPKTPAGAAVVTWQ